MPGFDASSASVAVLRAPRHALRHACASWFLFKFLEPPFRSLDNTALSHSSRQVLKSARMLARVPPSDLDAITDLDSSRALLVEPCGVERAE